MNLLVQLIPDVNCPLMAIVASYQFSKAGLAAAAH